MTQIFCDLDGVLVDFEGGYAQTFGHHHKSVPMKEMWRNIDSGGEEYWSGLPALPDHLLLWNYIIPYVPTILTGCPRTFKVAKVGKKWWCINNLHGEYGFVACWAKDKPKYLKNPGDVLIDDKAENCQLWIDVGGVAILHTSVADTLAQLEEMGI